MSVMRVFSAVFNFDSVTALEPATFTLTLNDLYRVRVVKYVAYWQFGDEIGDKAECHISVLLERKSAAAVHLQSAVSYQSDSHCVSYQAA